MNYLEPAPGRTVVNLARGLDAVILEPVAGSPWRVVGIFVNGELERVVDLPCGVDGMLAPTLAGCTPRTWYLAFNHIPPRRRAPTSVLLLDFLRAPSRFLGSDRNVVAKG
jgi:hypothetical protein